MHNRGEVRAIRPVAVALLVLWVAPSLGSQQPAADEPGITGQVTGPDGSPVTEGNVLLMRTAASTVTAAIDRTGRFHIVPDSTGAQRLFIAVPGLAPYRASVTVPPSRRVSLPAIALPAGTYFRARFVTPDGEPLSSGLRRQSIDGDGAAIPDPLGHTRLQNEADGSIVIGPLPHGRLLLVFDRPPLAQTRLPDINVAGTQPLIDRGVIVIQPGGQLHVDLRAADGAPVGRHDVFLEYAAQPSLLFIPAVKSDATGRAAFDRLAPGRYRVWTKTPDKCSGIELIISRQVSTSGRGATATRLVIGGRAIVRVASALGPLPGRAVYAAPDGPAQSPPWQTQLRSGPSGRPPITPNSTPSCRGVSDSEGRVVLEPFPPGPAQLRINLFNSTYIVRLNVPEGGREMAIVVPDGLVAAHVSDRESQQPIGSAQVMWTGGGGRVEALATPNGDVLLEGAGSTGGTLAVSARGYQPLEGSFEDTPGAPQEVALTPLPGSRLAVLVVSDGKPLLGAVIELHPRGAGDVSSFITTDAAGRATFEEVPLGTLRLSAHAEGFASATMSVAEDRRASIVINLTRAGFMF